MSKRDTAKQVKSIFRDELGGHVVASVDGPGGSTLEWWVLGLGMIIVQFWDDHWDYYLPGKKGKLVEIAPDVISHLDYKIV